MKASAPTPAPKRGLRADSLAEGVVILLAMMIIQRLFGFARGVIFCRWLDPEAFGEWGMVFNFLLLAAPVAVLGLPGSFGRYLEYYRQRGELRMFLRRTTCATLGLATLAVITIVWARAWFSEQIFGRSDLVSLVILTATALAVLIVHHFLESLFTALRMVRVVSGMQFFQSVAFALIGVGLLASWELSVRSIVLAYTLASLLSICGSAWWLRIAIRELTDDACVTPQSRFWAQLLPFTMWIWATNMLVNLFGYVDKYIVLHYSGLDSALALEQIGYYQSSLIVPALLVSVADLLAAVITPHLSEDWEAGRREAVSVRLNLVLKLVASGMLAAAVGVLLISPLLFGVAFQGKYDGGLHVLPWTLAYCVIFGLVIVAQNYLWCAEKARLGSLALLLGLGVNIVLSLILVPRLGLMGAVFGTLTANLATLALVYSFSYCLGMRLDRGTLLLSLAPLSLGFGWIPGMLVLALVALESIATDRLFTAHEKSRIADVGRGYVERFKAWNFSVGKSS